MRSARRATALAALALCAAGCHHDTGGATGCAIDDDCRDTACPQGELPVCDKGACGCGADLAIGNIGRYAAMALSHGSAYVCAYNADYGDLMIGHQAPPGVVTDWEFVDGVPEGVVPDRPRSRVRGGVVDPGDDVGSYCSIAITSAGDPVMAAYDATHHALRFAQFGAVRWQAQTIDGGKDGDDIGRYTSLTLDERGQPGIAYYAEVAKGTSGMPESQLRFAQAQTARPVAPTDWTITVVTSAPLPMSPGADGLPAGVALFIDSARRSDGAPVLVYHDHQKGNLVLSDFDKAAQRFRAPVVLDGQDAQGNKTGDVGWYPSVVVDQNDDAHIAYGDAAHGQLLYQNSRTRTPEVADDGYRPDDETTLDGLPAPVYHLVGDSSSIQLAGAAAGESSETPVVAYQDATTAQLRFARRDARTHAWTSNVIAGHAAPFAGSYGFYARARLAGSEAVISSYAIDQHQSPPRFYVEIFGVALGSGVQ